jgi:hypothetical protein
MSTDISAVLAKLESLEDDWSGPRIRAGLRVGAADAEAQLHATQAHGDITGATRAGYAAYVVSDATVDQAAAAAAIQRSVSAVQGLNPYHVDTAEGSLGVDGFGVILTCPTDYQVLLETENAGAKAALGPTLQTVADSLTARAANGG